MMSTATREICAKSSVKSGQPYTRLFCVLSAVVVVIGLSLHFVGLDRKFAWFDEGVSMEIIAGLPGSEFKEKIVTTDQLLNRLQVNTGLDSSVRIISKRHQDQLPIWFFLAKGWALAFGGNLVSLRTFSALFSIFAVPLFYWLVLEFTQSKRAAVIGSVLIAVSPFMMLFSAEARYYTIWIAVLIGISIALLRFCKTQNFQNALLFGSLLVAGAMTHLATLLIAPGAILFLLSQRLRWNLIIAALAPLLVVPLWFLFIGQTVIYDVSSHRHYGAFSMPVALWFEKARLNLARVFVDSGGTLPSEIVWVASSLAILFVLGILFLKETSGKQKAFFLCLLSSPLTFVVLDAVLSGRRAVIMRYQTVLIVAIYLAASFWLDKMLSRSKMTRVAGGFILVTLVSCGLWSSVKIAEKVDPWTKAQYCDLRASIKWIDRKKHPLFICGSRQITVFMAQMLPSKTRLLFTSMKKPNIPSDTDGIFLCDPFAEKGDEYFERLKKDFPHIPIKRVPHRHIPES